MTVLRAPPRPAGTTDTCTLGLGRQARPLFHSGWASGVLGSCSWPRGDVHAGQWRSESRWQAGDWSRGDDTPQGLCRMGQWVRGRVKEQGQRQDQRKSQGQYIKDMASGLVPVSIPGKQGGTGQSWTPPPALRPCPLCSTPGSFSSQVAHPRGPGAGGNPPILQSGRAFRRRMPF